MFIPIGGVFVFGGGGGRAGAVRNIVLALFNLAMGGVALAIGYSTGLLFLKVIGYVIAGLGALMLVINLFGLRRRAPEPDTAAPHT